MELTTPEAYLIARPQIMWSELESYLMEVRAGAWAGQAMNEACDSTVPPSDGQILVEVGGRLCYRSWEPGLNPNVTKVRTDRTEYLQNILRSKHGSVLEHANYTFILRNVSRVLTHELVRHRAGTAISQESGRYIRVTDLPFWFPEWAEADEDLLVRGADVLKHMEDFQAWMTERFELDAPGTSFHDKKSKTSFMRRFLPNGQSNDMMWTANVRALRHIIEVRTAPGAEEEVRLLFGQIARVMKTECPALFGDFFLDDDGTYTPEWSKV
jgi:thymidylate synthase (FAD)